MPLRLKFMIKKLSIRKLRLLGCACWRLIFPYIYDVSGYTLLRWTQLCTDIEDYVDDFVRINNLNVNRIKELQNKSKDLLDLSIILTTANKDLLINGLLSFFNVTTQHKDAQAEFIEDVIGEKILYIDCSQCHGTGQVHVPEPSYRRSMIPPRESCRSCQATGQFELSSMYKDNLFTPLIKSLAQQAYKDLPNTEGLLILSDALEDVQAPSNLLDHLRSSKSHIKGCSVLDLILGKS